MNKEKIVNKKRGLKKVFLYGFLTFFVLGIGSFAEDVKNENFSAYEGEKNYQFYKDIVFDEESDNGIYSFEIDSNIRSQKSQGGNSSWYRDVVLLEKDQERTIPFSFHTEKDSQDCSAVTSEIKKVYESYGDNTAEFILDFGNQTNGLQVIDVKRSLNNSFSASYEVFGSHLKNSGYEKINIQKPYGVLDTRRVDGQISATKKYRYVKINLTVDEGVLENVRFSRDASSCQKITVDKNSVDFEVLESKKVEKTQEYILDTKREYQGLDFLIFSPNNNIDFERSASVFGANSLDALQYENNNRYDSSKEYWREIQKNRTISVDGLKKSLTIDLNNSNYRYYKIVVYNGDDANIGFGWEFLAEKEFIFFETGEVGGVRVYYGTEKSKENVQLLQYNDFQKKALHYTQENSGKAVLSDQKENIIFEEKSDITKTESKIFIYGGLSLLMIFLSWYLWRIFRDTDKKEDIKK